VTVGGNREGGRINSAVRTGPCDDDLLAHPPGRLAQLGQGRVADSLGVVVVNAPDEEQLPSQAVECKRRDSFALSRALDEARRELKVPRLQIQGRQDSPYNVVELLVDGTTLLPRLRVGKSGGHLHGIALAKRRYE
jgi:hypothetical protein